jgi:hypothetical protein
LASKEVSVDTEDHTRRQEDNTRRPLLRPNNQKKVLDCSKRACYSIKKERECCYTISSEEGRRKKE